MKKKLGFILSLVVVLAAIATLLIMSTVVAEADTPITISVEKTTFAIGEDIAVTYSGLDESYKNMDIELRLDLIADRTDMTLTGKASMQDIDLGTDCNNGGKSIWRGESATVHFATDYRKASPGWGTNISAGTYTLRVLQYSPTRTTISNVLTITIMASKITTNKLEYASGENIEITFDYFTGYAGAEIRIDANHGLDPLTYTKNRASFGSSKWCDTVASHTDGKVTYSSATDRFGNAITPGKYTVWIMYYTGNTIISNQVEITIYQTVVSTDKTQYYLGDSVDVYFTSFATTTDAELRIDTGWGKDPATYPANRVESVDYVVCNDFMTAGKATFTTDGKRSISQLPIGKYTIWVMTYTKPSLKIISNKIEIEVVARSNPVVSIEKTNFVFGEDIVVSYDYIFPTLSTSGQNVELRLYRGNGVIGKDASLQYLILVEKNALTTAAGTGKGSIAFPKEGGRTNVSDLTPGDYYIVLLNGNTIIGSKINFTVGTPTISLDKTTFAYGETIKVNYANISGKLSTVAKSDLELRLYKKDDVIGKVSSIQYFIFANTSDQILLTESSDGSINFPSEGGRSYTGNLPAGDYYLVLVNGNTIIYNNNITFTVAPAPMNEITLPGENVKAVSAEVDAKVGFNVFLKDVQVGDKLVIKKNGEVIATIDAVAGDFIEIGGVNSYKVVSLVNAKEIGDKFVITLKRGDSEIYSTDAFSTADYCKLVINDKNAYGQEAVNVCKAMLVYGGYTQKLLGYRTDSLAYDGVSGISTPSAKDYTDYKATGSDESTTLSFAGSRVTFLSTLSIKLYFLADNSDVVANHTFKVNGSDATATEVASEDTYFKYFMVEIDDIAVDKLATDVVVTVDSDITVNYNVFSYAADVAAQTGDKWQATKDVMSALLDYYNAVIAYAQD